MFTSTCPNDSFTIASRPVRVGRLRRLRVDELAEEGPAALLDHPDHLLQLRVGVRPPRLRRQGDADRPQVRGQPAPSRAAAAAPAPRASSRRTRSRIPIASSIRCSATGARGDGRVGARDVGRGARRHRRRASARRFVEGRRDEMMYHVGRPGEDGYANRVLQAWGVDGHNSHTNVCSSSARLGHFLWTGDDRPSPDYANARDHPAALVAPRDRPLLQPARAAHHRRHRRTARR